MNLKDVFNRPMYQQFIDDDDGNRKLSAYLEINDLLGFTGPITVAGVVMDAIVNVKVVQTGADLLEIKELVIVDDMIDFLYDSGTIKHVSARLEESSSYFLLIEEFIEQVKTVAIKRATETPELNWSYKLE